MLRGLIDKNTRGLREGSSLILELRPAGQKLKLQLKVKKFDAVKTKFIIKKMVQILGPVLNWNPQTGSLQLSQIATQKVISKFGRTCYSKKGYWFDSIFPISEN